MNCSQGELPIFCMVESTDDAAAWILVHSFSWTYATIHLSPCTKFFLNATIHFNPCTELFLNATIHCTTPRYLSAERHLGVVQSVVDEVMSVVGKGKHNHSGKGLQVQQNTARTLWAASRIMYKLCVIGHGCKKPPLISLVDNFIQLTFWVDGWWLTWRMP